MARSVCPVCRRSYASLAEKIRIKTAGACSRCEKK